MEANDVASCPSNSGGKLSFTATASVKASDWGRRQLKPASLKRRIKGAWWKERQMRQELSPAALILWKRSGCDDPPWLFSAVNIEPSSSRRVCAPSNPSCRVFSSSLHHAPLSLSASCPIVSLAFLLFFSPCLLLTVCPTVCSTPSSALRHRRFHPSRHFTSTPSVRVWPFNLPLPRHPFWVRFLANYENPEDDWFLFRGREGWNQCGQSLSPSQLGWLWACGCIRALCGHTRTLVSIIIITGSRCLGHGCDIRAPSACLRWGGCSKRIREVAPPKRSWSICERERARVVPVVSAADRRRAHVGWKWILAPDYRRSAQTG